MSRSFTANDMMTLLGKYGWALHEQRGSHAQFVHPVLSGRVTVERHAGRDLPVEIVKSIFSHAGMERFFKMFQRGQSFKAVKNAIQAEARERFGRAERVAVPSDVLANPRPDVT